MAKIERILGSFPYLPVPSSLQFPRQPGRTVQAFPYQIFVWVSLTPPATEWDELDENPPVFPALLDTGCNHNFYIPEYLLFDHAMLWADEDLPPSPWPDEPVNGVLTRSLPADIWIHRNIRGMRDELSDETPFKLETDGGIAVPKAGEEEELNFAILGLKALTTAKCRLLIDCERRLVSLRTRTP